MHGTDQLPQPLNARLKVVKYNLLSVEYSMHCINYAKREQEKSLLFKLTLQSRQLHYQKLNLPSHKLYIIYISHDWPVNA